MRIVWSPRALTHLTALRDYIAQDSPDSAAGVAGRILESVELLARHPEIGRAGRITGTRELIVPGTPYIVPYRLRRDRLELTAAFHGRQKWPAKL
jgi:addiction module RelE/StbE family toxin